MAGLAAGVRYADSHGASVRAALAAAGAGAVAGYEDYYGAAARAASPPASAPRVPRCPTHNVQITSRTCGPKSMPHNRGRTFLCCPRAVRGDPGCDSVWQWADGTTPGGEEAQARLRAHVERHGVGGYNPATLRYE